MASTALLDRRAANEAVYDRLWSMLPLYPHTGWSIWPELQKELAGGRWLELGAGVLPRSPVQGGVFADVSRSALRKLAGSGGHSVRATGLLPFRDRAFRAVCAFEVLEHIEGDDQVIAEVARVLSPGGAFLLSVPVDPALYTHFDAVCEHVRRYDAGALADQLQRHGLRVERWATHWNKFGRLFGWLLGATLRLAMRHPSLLCWLKKSSLREEMRHPLRWRAISDHPILESHKDGGLTIIARREG